MNPVFDRVIVALQSSRDSNGSPLNIESLIYTDDDGTRQHHFTPPKQVNLRSIAKPIACLALGKALDQGMTWAGEAVSLSTKVWPLLSEIVDARAVEAEDAWKQVTIRDLLRSTIGHKTGLLFSKDIKGRDPSSLLDYVVSQPIPGKVGKDFVYSNAGLFVLSSLISKFSGVDLDQFVQDHLFSPLGVRDVKWERFGRTVAGCTGLWMSNVDLHRVGRLLLNDGSIDGVQIVPSAFIAEMKTPQVPVPTHRFVPGRAFPKWSYGLCLWICEDGTYYCDGTDGQYLIVFPNKKAVATLLASQPDTIPISDSLGLFK
jgi:CubicO group peptidase (beta-lactamase class C family)